MIPGNAEYGVGILAGGKSTRMGKNKALLEYESQTFISRIIEQFKDLEIIISANEPLEKAACSVVSVADENKDIGPIEGIRQILKSSDKEYVFVCACDMPFITKDIADYIAGYISSDYDCYVITDEDRIHPLCAIYSKRILPVIEDLILKKQYRLRGILDNTRTRYISLSYTVFDKKTVRNINTKEEYRELKLPVVFAVSGYKDSGKTWLITELINEFISDGYSVGVIKHDGHDSIEETPDTDTYRYSEAGALITAVFSDSKYVISSKTPKTPEDLIRYVKNMDGHPDVIILEGFKHSSYPKVILEDDRRIDVEDESAVIVRAGVRPDRDVTEYIYGRIKELFEL